MAFLKVVLITFLAALGLCGFGAVALAGYLVTGGIATVQVDTPDVDLNIPVPMRLLDLGLGVASAATVAAPQEEMRDFYEARAQLEPWKPLLRDLGDEIHNLPEGELVRVKTESERVIITHRRGRISVEVETPDTHVKVSAPRRAIGRVFNKSVALATD